MNKQEEKHLATREVLWLMHQKFTVYALRSCFDFLLSFFFLRYWSLIDDSESVKIITSFVNEMEKLPFSMHHVKKNCFRKGVD